MEYDVAIIGCGPVGALAANLLGRAGVRTLVVEQETKPHPLPRAVHIDHEMKRLFQAAGVVDAVAADMRETDGHLHIGADQQMIRYMGTVGKERAFGWANDYFFYQPELEAHLRDALRAYPNVSFRSGTSFQSLQQDHRGVSLNFRSGDADWQARAAWVIGCDGAKSAVRRALRIALEDLQFEEPWLVVDAEVEGPVRFPDLIGLPPEADLQRLSVMMCDPRRPATVVPGRGNHRRWEFMLLPGEDDDEMMRPEKVAQLLEPYLDGIPHRITRAATYRFHGLVAVRWQSGRVFLAGDAAHQTPPFFGQGMCHGMRDVANLAWKLDLVVRGVADEALLHTYQPERDPHVRAVISAAVEAGRYICILDPEAAARRDAEMREKAKDAAPSTAADLIPAIGEGVVASDSAGAGERFIQPLVACDGSDRLLDDITGSGWRIIVRDGSLVHGTERAANAVAQLHPTIIDAAKLDDRGAIGRWLDRHGADVVLVRPDFYVFGTARGDAAPLIAELAEKLQLRIGMARKEEAAA